MLASRPSQTGPASVLSQRLCSALEKTRSLNAAHSLWRATLRTVRLHSTKFNTLPRTVQCSSQCNSQCSPMQLSAKPSPQSPKTKWPRFMNARPPPAGRCSCFEPRHDVAQRAPQSSATGPHRSALSLKSSAPKAKGGPSKGAPTRQRPPLPWVACCCSSGANEAAWLQLAWSASLVKDETWPLRRTTGGLSRLIDVRVARPEEWLQKWAHFSLNGRRFSPPIGPSGSAADTRHEGEWAPQRAG